jgi:hypothetical protein
VATAVGEFVADLGAGGEAGQVLVPGGGGIDVDFGMLRAGERGNAGAVGPQFEGAIAGGGGPAGDVELMEESPVGGSGGEGGRFEVAVDQLGGGGGEDLQGGGLALRIAEPVADEDGVFGGVGAGEAGELESGVGGVGDGVAVPVPQVTERGHARGGDAEGGGLPFGSDHALGLGGDERGILGNRPDLDAADGGVGEVPDVEDSERVDDEGSGVGEFGGFAGAVPGSAHAAAGDGGHLAGGCEAADDMVSGIGDVEVAGLVEGEAGGIAEARLAGGTVAVSGLFGAGDGGHLAGGGDLADAMGGAFLGHVEVAVGVEHEAERKVEAGGEPVAVGVSGLAGAGPGGHRAVGGDAADDVVGGLGEEEVAVGVGDDVLG